MILDWPLAFDLHPLEGPESEDQPNGLSVMFV